MKLLSRVSGIVQNTGKKEIASADLLLDLTDSTGTQLGAVVATVERIPASGRREFNLSVKQRGAAYALVRDIVTRK